MVAVRGSDENSKQDADLGLPLGAVPVARSAESSDLSSRGIREAHPFCVCGSELVDGHCQACETSAVRRQPWGYTAGFLAPLVLLVPQALLAWIGGAR